MRETVTRSIVGCARCHGDGHADLVFEKLDHPMELEGHKIEWWAMCPVTNQPIMMMVLSQ